ncbi:MAG: hypothetical protein KatS3mg129_3153 [Leptospiraceae bacterium]|nr:MAG: hypothetical protein KatS3mg129_3153 [Leptospiraceae bacterium]
MDSLNNSVKSFKTLRVVKSFFYLIIILFLTNYIINHYIIWYVSYQWLSAISIVLFLVIYALLKKILQFGKIYHISFISLMLFILIIKTFIFDIKKISGISMKPSLKDGQWVLIDKLHYGINIPYFLFPFGTIGYKKICLKEICYLQKLKRFDIVIFDFPDPVIKERIWIKRIIGLENEEYEFKDNALYINRKKLDFYSHIDFLTEYHSTPIFILPEELKIYPSIYQFFFLNGTGEKGIIPDGSYLLIGDNTKFSRDSRIYGFIPKDRIIGKVIYAF